MTSIFYLNYNISSLRVPQMCQFYLFDDFVMPIQKGFFIENESLLQSTLQPNSQVSSSMS